MQLKIFMVFSKSLKRCGYSSGVERNLAKVDVVGPNPIARSNKDVRCCSYVIFFTKCPTGVPFKGVIHRGDTLTTPKER